MSAHQQQLFLERFSEDMDRVRAGDMTMEKLGRRAAQLYESFFPMVDPDTTTQEPDLLAQKTSPANVPETTLVSPPQTAPETVPIRFSSNKQIATHQMINIIKKDFPKHHSAHNWKNGVSYYQIKGICRGKDHARRVIIVENFGSKFGLISTTGTTDTSPLVTDWDKFGNCTTRKQFDYTGHPTHEVLEMIRQIIS